MTDSRKPETILRQMVEAAYDRGLTTSEVMAECCVSYQYAQEVRQRLRRLGRV